MSISTELAQLAANKAAIKAAIEAKNPATAPTNDLSQWPTAIASIPSGGGGVSGHTLTLNGVSDIAPHDVIDGLFRYLKTDGTSGTTDFYNGVDSNPKIVQDVLCYAYPSGGDNHAEIRLLTEDTTLRVKVPCLAAGTKILLADGKEKNIEDIAYSDTLAVWDFEHGCLAGAKPLWICRGGTTDFVYRCRFSSGRELLVTGPYGHRGFSLEKSTFAYLPECVADDIATIDGNETLIDCTRETGEFRYHNIITDGHLNLYANGVLTSCRLNNYRSCRRTDMRFDTPNVHHHAEKDFNGIPERYVRGLHLCNQPGSVEELKKYVGNLIARAM